MVLSLLAGIKGRGEALVGLGHLYALGYTEQDTLTD